MQFSDLHPWTLSATEAVALQRELAKRVILKPLRSPIRLITACDVSFNIGGDTIFAALAAWDREAQRVVEEVTVEVPATFPYRTGLLSFRELPAVLEAFRQLKKRPDGVLCDGQGIAHPRRLGIASHLGLWLDLPTIGSAKSRLTGTFQEPGLLKGSYSPLMDKGDVIGDVLRSKDKVAPLFVSPGHLCSREDAREIVMSLVGRYRIPDPIRHVHDLSNKVRKAKLAGPSASLEAQAPKARKGPTDSSLGLDAL